MPSLQLVFQIIMGLGPYFSVAIFLAIVLGLFLPWGVMNPQKWLYLYIIGLCLLPFGANDTDGSGSLYKQLTWTLLYILCFVSVVRFRDNIAAQKINIPIELLLLYGFIFITIAWSDYKLSSFKRYILLIGLLLIAILSSKLSVLEKSFANLVDKPLAFFMLIGLVVAVAWPRLAFDADGALRAFTSHKNTWGQFMLLCSLVFFNNVLSRSNRLIYLPLLMISLGMLYMSKSATSLLAFLLVAFWDSPAKILQANSSCLLLSWQPRCPRWSIQSHRATYLSPVSSTPSTRRPTKTPPSPDEHSFGNSWVLK